MDSSVPPKKRFKTEDDSPSLSQANPSTDSLLADLAALVQGQTPQPVMSQQPDQGTSDDIASQLAALASMLQPPASQPQTQPQPQAYQPQSSPQTYQMPTQAAPANQYNDLLSTLMMGMNQPQMQPQPSYSQTTSVVVTVEGVDFNFEFTEDDLRSVFSRYGAVKSVRLGVGATGRAVVTFMNANEAAGAIQDLNGKVLNGVAGRLKVDWFLDELPSQHAISQPAYNPYPSQPQQMPSANPLLAMLAAAGMGGMGQINPQMLDALNQVMTQWGSTMGGGQQPPAQGMYGQQPSRYGGPLPPQTSAFSDNRRDQRPGSDRYGDRMGSNDRGGDRGGRKYTCRIDVMIDNEKDFQVARRIIGHKGTNMKRIVSESGAKLRLRGKGSGFLEGPGKQESPEPLHLCISCREERGYRIAVDLADELMRQVHDDYRRFCMENGREVPANLMVVKMESVTNVSGRDYDRGDKRHRDVYESREDYMSRPSDRDPYRDYAGGGPRGGPPSMPSSFASPSAGPTPVTGRNPRISYAGDPNDVASENAPPVHEIETLIEQRNEARRVCNFKEADRIREYLRSRGIALMDEPGGRGKGKEVTTWRYWRS